METSVELMAFLKAGIEKINTRVKRANTQMITARQE
jgi:hypothetical protein